MQAAIYDVSYAFIPTNERVKGFIFETKWEQEKN